MCENTPLTPIRRLTSLPRWQWRSFLVGGGSAAWLFLYGIYYWATQPEDANPTTNTPAAGLQNSEPYLSDQGADGGSASNKQKQKLEPASPAKGEWAQTIGTFKPAFRPVPARWRGSEILGLLRRHVKERSAAGVLGNNDRDKAEGMAFMPPLGERK